MIAEEKMFRYREDLKYIVLDTETESLNLHLSRCWEIAWLVIENGKIVKEYQKFPFIHDLAVSKGAAQITRFNYNDWKAKSEDPKKVYELLASYLYNPEYLVVAQNGLFFDVYQIANFQRYLGEKIDYSYINRVYDTLALGRANLLGAKFPDSKGEITPWMYRFCGFFQKGLKASLGALCKQFDIVYDDTKVHEGLKDVFLTHEVFKKLYWQLEVWN